jgi:hypothetical protein
MWQAAYEQLASVEGGRGFCGLGEILGNCSLAIDLLAVDHLVFTEDLLDCVFVTHSHEAEAAGTASVSVLHKRAFLNNPKVLEVANKQLASSVHRESAHEDLLG